MQPRPSQVPPFVQSRYHLAPTGATAPNQAATCIAQPSLSFSHWPLPPSPAFLILFVGILVQAKPRGQGQMLSEAPSLPPQLQAARSEQGGGVHA